MKGEAMTAIIEKAVQGILTRFESGDIPEAIAYSLFPTPNIPSSEWSLLNRMLMYLGDTVDARGIRQWNRIGRRVKKGSKAIYILVPRMVKKKTDQEENNVLIGFLCKPVFRVEDTDGDPLDYEPPAIPDALPLMDKAREWGIAIEAMPGNNGYYGYYAPGSNRISMATTEETVFFHELAHAAHHRVTGGIKCVQDWKQEIVAELSAAVLCSLVGKTTKSLGNSHRYIEGHAKDAGLNPVQGCLRVIGDVEKVLRLILEPVKETLEPQQIAV
jgi:hypothetical protein